MTPELQQKIAKIYELVKRGTDGEQAAAKKKLDSILAKYDLDNIDLDSLDKMEYTFKYGNNLELNLLTYLVRFLLDNHEWVFENAYRRTWDKSIVMKLSYVDQVNVSCAFEYFRRHMKTQWTKTFLPEVNKCRKAKTKNKRRAELQTAFFNSYMIKSGLIPEQYIERVDLDLQNMSDKEYREWLMRKQIEGGQYNKQMHTGLLLEN